MLLLGLALPLHCFPAANLHPERFELEPEELARRAEFRSTGLGSDTSP